MGSDLRVFVFDDYTYAQTGRKEEAAHTGCKLVWGQREVLLDLTDDHYRELFATLEPWLKAGHRADKVNTGSRTSGRHPRAYYEGLRKFAADRGVELTADGSGKYSYPPQLRREFEESLRE